MNEAPYVLGHRPAEIRRLELQAELLAPPTRHTLQAIGLAKGMRVLDIGTGAGDVAAMAAEFVGPAGRVVGIDRSADVLARARARFPHVAFELASPDEMEAGAFDLVIGRFVALFQPDDVAFLRGAARLVAPGGTVAFIEPAMSARTEVSWPPVALYDEVGAWIFKGFVAGGATLTRADRCVKWFARAGLPEPSLRREVPVGGPSSIFPEWLALTLESLVPALEKAGLARREEFDLPTLPARLRAAAARAQAVIGGPPVSSAWARVG